MQMRHLADTTDRSTKTTTTPEVGKVRQETRRCLVDAPDVQRKPFDDRSAESNTARADDVAVVSRFPQRTYLYVRRLQPAPRHYTDTITCCACAAIPPLTSGDSYFSPTRLENEISSPTNAKVRRRYVSHYFTLTCLDVRRCTYDNLRV